MKFNEILEYLSMPCDIAELIMKQFLSRKQFFHRNAKNAYQEINGCFLICKNSPLERLIIWCCLLPDVAQKYWAEGTPEEIIRSTVYDITRLAVEYKKQTGKFGLSKENVIWLRHLYYTDIFQIGSLQFQQFKMVYLDEEGCGEAYMSFSLEQKARLPQGTSVVNVHIPKGADLSPQKVEDSFSTATLFFTSRFDDFVPQAFLCYSWLLYPDLKELLPITSNIRSFAQRFKIIGTVCDPFGSGAVKHIYGRRYPNLASYPKHTQLQRNAIGNFSKLGMACGIVEIS